MTAESSSIPLLDLAVLVSGGGTTLQNLLQHIKSGSLKARVRVVVSSRPEIRGLVLAEEAGIPHHLCDRSIHSSTSSFSRGLAEQLTPYQVDLVCMGGFLDLWKIPDLYRGRVMNIHPALLPAFGGRGFYGRHVHEAVLRAGVSTTGCTVHFCDDEYDQGPIILQRTVPVLPGDTPDSLQERVFEAECEAYPEAIRLFQTNRLTVESGKVVVG